MRKDQPRSRNTIQNRYYWASRWRCKCSYVNMNYDKRCFECKRLKPIQTRLIDIWRVSPTIIKESD